jgi:hypothetical protein
LLGALWLAGLAPMAGCEGEPIVLGVDLCEPTSCGAELAVPSRQCADGTTAGYTGRCMRDEVVTSCHWEIVACPPPVACLPDDCGPFPVAYTVEVDEEVACRRAPDGACRWMVMPLPGCEPSDCGAPPESASARICPEGSLAGFTGQCVIGPDGACGWEERACTTGATALDGPCSLDECGEQPPESRIACVDGSTGGTTGRCIRSDDGVCTWEVRSCPPPVACGDNRDCGDGRFCDRSAVACAASIRGMCSLRPTECPRYTDAVDRRICACDGLTYDSACEAQRLGVSVAYDGPCT